MYVKRIVGRDGKLLGFVVNGQLIERDDELPADLSMRKLEIELVGKLYNAERDETSKAAEDLIELDRLRLEDMGAL